MGKYIIREGKPEDAKEYIEYLKSIFSETDFLTSSSEEVITDINMQESFIKKCSETDNFLFLVATYDDEIIGNLIFRGHEKVKQKHLGEFGTTVLKSHWGKGVAGKLVSEMIQWAKNTKFIKKISLKVREDNNRAIELYKRHGFKKEGEISKDIFINNQYYKSIIMGLDLENSFNYDICFDKNLDPVTIRDFYCSYSTWKVPVLSQIWQEIINNSEVFITIWDNDKLIGAGRALSDKVRWATIVDVLVSPDYRKKGIGTKLMQTILSRNEMQVRSIFISTDETEGFYEHLGFSTISNCCSCMLKINMEADDSYILPM